MNCVDCNQEVEQVEIDLFGKCLSCHIDDLTLADKNSGEKKHD